MPSHPVFLKSYKESVSLLEELRDAPMAEGGGSERSGWRSLPC